MLFNIGIFLFDGYEKHSILSVYSLEEGHMSTWQEFLWISYHTRSLGIVMIWQLTCQQCPTPFQRRAAHVRPTVGMYS